MNTELQRIIKSFKNKRILIIGDVMIDSYYSGTVSRISPEAPVPIVNIKNKEVRLGGAANVALNIQSLGGIPLLCATIGQDHAGEDFLHLLEQNQLSSEGIMRIENRKTTVKSRILGNKQQLVRLDEEEVEDLTGNPLEQFLLHTDQFLETQSIDAIIFEDYDKGTLAPGVIKRVIAQARQRNIPTLVDPKKRHFFDYKGVSLFKPNLKELKEGLELEINSEDKKHFLEAVQNLELKLEQEYTLVTLSEKGIFIKKGEEHHFFPAHLRNITDVSGAGDTVIAVAAMALIGNATQHEIALISNLAGGLVCELPGVVSVSAEQLTKELDKLYS